MELIKNLSLRTSFTEPMRDFMYKDPREIPKYILNNLHLYGLTDLVLCPGYV